MSDAPSSPIVIKRSQYTYRCVDRTICVLITANMTHGVILPFYRDFLTLAKDGQVHFLNMHFRGVSFIDYDALRGLLEICEQGADLGIRTCFYMPNHDMAALLRLCRFDLLCDVKVEGAP